MFSCRIFWLFTFWLITPPSQRLWIPAIRATVDHGDGNRARGIHKRRSHSNSGFACLNIHRERIPSASSTIESVRLSDSLEYSGRLTWNNKISYRTRATMAQLQLVPLDNSSRCDRERFTVNLDKIDISEDWEGKSVSVSNYVSASRTHIMEKERRI
jgi:uncharacterized protein (DUF736 family)